MVNPAILIGGSYWVAFEENEFTRGLEPKARKTAIEGLLLGYLELRTHSTPLLLVLEDCHWLDESSADLVRLISQAITTMPLMLILAYRPADEKV